jgi:hypothetical protein
MPSELDRRYTTTSWPRSPGPAAGQIGRDEQGRGDRRPTSRRPCRLFDAFCMLHGATEAVVADGERLTFAELNEHFDAVAHGLAGGFGIAKGDRVAIAMRNCPAWIVCLHGALKAGAIATLSTAGGRRTSWPRPRPDRARSWSSPTRRARSGSPRPACTIDHRQRCRSSSRSTGAGAAASPAAARMAALPEIAPRTTRPSCSPRARPACQGRALDPPRGDHRHLRLFDQG